MSACSAKNEAPAGAKPGALLETNLDTANLSPFQEVATEISTESSRWSNTAPPPLTPEEIARIEASPDFPKFLRSVEPPEDEDEDDEDDETSGSASGHRPIFPVAPRVPTLRDYEGKPPDNRVARAWANVANVVVRNGTVDLHRLARLVGVDYALNDPDATGVLQRHYRRHGIVVNEGDLRGYIRMAAQEAAKTGEPDAFGAALRDPGTSLPRVVMPCGAQTVAGAATRLGGLLDSTEEFFMHGGVIKKLDGDNVLTDVKPAGLISMFERVAVLVKPGRAKNGQESVPERVICSKAQAEAIAESEEFQASIRPLSMVVPCPIIAERDGALVEIVGYDRPSATLARGQVPDRVSLGEARAMLADIVDSFNPLTPGDRARALVAMLTPAMLFGDLIGGRAPADMSEAQESQTGKGYRHKITAAIYNQSVNTVAQNVGRGVGSVEESFDSLLVQGASFVSIDNIRGRLDSQKIESFMTEDVYQARVPYRAPMRIDPRRMVVMLTSNKADLTSDMANRLSIVRLVKHPDGHVYRPYPEGDILAHVQANQGRYLGAVFAVVRAWHAAGKPRIPGQPHDFRAWAEIMDWISINLLDAGPLLDGHRAAQGRTANPTLNWLREAAMAVDKMGLLGQWLKPGTIVGAMEDTGRDIPGSGNGHGMEEDESPVQAWRTAGRRLGKCFGMHGTVAVDNWTVERQLFRDNPTRQDRPQYRFTRIGQG